MKAEWFAGRLAELRLGAGLSRKELADRAGMRSQAGIRNLEQGIYVPGWDTVLALCKVFGVTPDAFAQEPSGDVKLKAGRPKKATDPVPNGSKLSEKGPPDQGKPQRRRKPKRT
jgi:transcriptional regulator with XRE-family HTH domain